MMRAVIMMIFFGLAWLLRILGGVALLWLLIYGIYALFAKSVLLGLMLIGGAVVGGWVIRLASGLLLLVGVGAASIGVKSGEDNT